MEAGLALVPHHIAAFVRPKLQYPSTTSPYLRTLPGHILDILMDIIPELVGEIFICTLCTENSLQYLKIHYLALNLTQIQLINTTQPSSSNAKLSSRLPPSTCLEFNFNNSLVWDLVLGLNCQNLFPGQNFLSVTKTFPEPTKLS